MTQLAADFWNGDVWDQWKEKWPWCATFMDNHPKDSVHLKLFPQQITTDIDLLFLGKIMKWLNTVAEIVKCC